MLSQLSKVHKSANIEHILFIVVLIVQGTFSGGSKNVIRSSQELISNILDLTK